jgi:carboxyl-terminal processing protease
LVVGSPTTHGKGSVQELIGLDRWLTRIGEPEAAARAGAIKYTSAMFFRVNGSSTQRKGVLADVVLPSPYRGLKISEADLDAALAWDQVPPAAYRRAELNAPLATLQQRSEARVASSEEFRWLAADVAEREATDARNTLLLQLSARRAEVDANTADEAARDAARASRGWKEGDDLPDFLLDEALAVTADWLATARTGAR